MSKPPETSTCVGPEVGKGADSENRTCTENGKQSGELKRALGNSGAIQRDPMKRENSGLSDMEQAKHLNVVWARVKGYPPWPVSNLYTDLTACPQFCT